MSDQQPGCSKSVRVPPGMWSQNHPCAREGKVERDGEWWCKQHDPEEVKRREQKRSEAFEVKRAGWHREAVVMRACKDLPTDWLAEGGLPRLVRYCTDMASVIETQGEPELADHFREALP